MNPSDIHACTYQCERPACIRRQRDELYTAILLQEPGFTAADMADQYATAFERGRESVLAERNVISAGDAVFAFASMLTALPHVVPFGASAWATPGADLASAFNRANGLEVSVDFPAWLVFPKMEGGLLETVRQASQHAAAQEAVAWTVVGPDGKSSIGGWHVMETHDFWKEAGVLREGHRYAYAYAAPIIAAPGIDLRNLLAEMVKLHDERKVVLTVHMERLKELLIDASPKGGSEARDAALNTLAQMFHNSEEMEGPDGMVVSIDLSLWHEALEAYEVLIDGYDEVTLATSAQAQDGDAEVQP